MRSTRNLIRIVSVSAILAAAVFGSKNARAEADTFGLGSGRTGAGSIIAANTVVNAYAGITASVVSGDTSVHVDVGATFSPGDLVLIWQTTGLAAAASGVQTAIPLDGVATGSFEYARVKSITANVVTLTNPIVSTSGFALGTSQMVKIPEYTSLSIGAAGSIVATPWDGSKGGIVAVFAQGTITNAGSIIADGAGLRGGVLKNDDKVFGCVAIDGPVVAGTAIVGGGGATFNALAGGAKKGEGLLPTGYSTDIVSAATDPLLNPLYFTYGNGNVSNGGGGGDCHNSGGGGGGHGGVGGMGGETWADETNLAGGAMGSRAVGGTGGASLTSAPVTRISMGGGGGAGEENDSTSHGGGNGGGAILIRANALTGAGAITANGVKPADSANDGAGGGGAGGAIVLRIATTAACGSIQALGGAGGSSAADHGPGGGGSGGVILVQGATGTTCGTAANVTGGASGTDGASARGSTGGAGGTTPTPPTGGFTPTTCDVSINDCGGCVVNSDCAVGFLCNTTTNFCSDFFPDGGLVPDGGMLLPDGGLSFPDGGLILPDGGLLTDGGLLADGGFADGGSSDGGSGNDGGSTGDGGFGDDGGDTGDGGHALGGDLGDDSGDLEGGGCSTSGSNSDGTGAAAIGLGLIAALAFMRRKKR
ncbi:MAG: MYXO-CTERM sorting domain-containing protein [Polyangiaceae bacterium]